MNKIVLCLILINSVLLFTLVFGKGTKKNQHYYVKNQYIKVTGRHAIDSKTNAIQFDHPGIKLEAKITGTTKLNLVMSKIGPRLVYFHIYCNKMFIKEINTSTWRSGRQISISNICNNNNNNLIIMDKASTYNVLIIKETEAQFSATTVVANYITFHNFTGDSTMVVSPPPSFNLNILLPRKKIEFLGDSITAGFCNMCKIESRICGPKPDHGQTCEAQQHFSSSWANLICDYFQADCHIEAWSGFGMYENCCGGNTVMPDIYKRTLATVVSSNSSDPHGTVKDNLWDFTKWIPDAVVINLGTNDLLNRRPENVYKYNETYLNLILETSRLHGINTHFFLACGPMSTAYCNEVDWILQTVTKPPYSIKASFLDQRNYLNGTYGPSCCGHPSASVDKAISHGSIKRISEVMHW